MGFLVMLLVALIVGFLADALVTTSIRSLPSACGPYDGNPLSEWLKSYRTVEALDFDVLAAEGLDARPVLDGGVDDWETQGNSLVHFRRCGSH